MKVKYLSVGIISIFLLGSCSKTTTSVLSSAAYTTPEPVCMGVERDGSQTLRVWGKGSNAADAIEQAKKNAVYEVLFKGIRGTGECEKRPLVTEVNARERYANYFNPFFKDGGEYKDFVTEETAGKASRLEAKGSSIVSYGVIVTVDREGLRQRLERDGVL